MNPVMEEGSCMGRHNRGRKWRTTHLPSPHLRHDRNDAPNARMMLERCQVLKILNEIGMHQWIHLKRPSHNKGLGTQNHPEPGRVDVTALMKVTLLSLVSDPASIQTTER